MVGFDYYQRVSRLGRHIRGLFIRSDESWVPWRGLHYWIFDLLFVLLDIMLLPEIHRLLSYVTGMRGRQLSDEEIVIAQQYFGEHIHLPSVRIWEGLGRKLSRRVHAFVSFNTINCTHTMSKAVYVHELVHVWQYQRFGSLYIPRALAAQWSEQGYDYGGSQALYHSMIAGGRFVDYNFEQQGDIFQDYYMASNHGHRQYSPLQMAVYAYFVDQVRNPTTI